LRRSARRRPAHHCGGVRVRRRCACRRFSGRGRRLTRRLRASRDQGRAGWTPPSLRDRYPCGPARAALRRLPRPRLLVGCARRGARWVLIEFARRRPLGVGRAQVPSDVSRACAMVVRRAIGARPIFVTRAVFLRRGGSRIR
jgi:hypothetical protein